MECILSNKPILHPTGDTLESLIARNSLRSYTDKISEGYEIHFIPRIRMHHYTNNKLLLQETLLSLVLFA